jgi:hypothetical protein
MPIDGVRCWAALALAVPLVGAATAGEIDLASHRAVYDLSLTGAGEPSGFAPIVGRLVVEMVGSRCAGYTSTTRFVTQAETDDGERLVTDARSRTFETVDGFFEFEYENFENDRIVERTSGTARRGPRGIAVELSKPATRKFVIDPDAVLPSEQMIRTIRAARTGERFLALDVYDGQDGGETVYATATVIGSAAIDAKGEVAPSIDEPRFAGLTRWPLTISYFPKDGRTDDRPTYVVSIVTYENGVANGINIDYGDFGFTGALSQLEMLAPEPCP